MCKQNKGFSALYKFSGSAQFTDQTWFAETQTVDHNPLTYSGLIQSIGVL